MQTTANVLPWGEGLPDPNQVYILNIDQISLPDLRVTSTFTPEQTSELRESLKTEGQKDPVKVVLANGVLVLADGLNRILGLKVLGVNVVKALVVQGSLRDVQIANVITARHRGRENPAQTAEVLRDLVDNEKMTAAEIRQRLGLSEGAYRRLYAISRLPDEVKDHVKYARLGVGAAYHIAQLGDPVAQITLATQAVDWKYTEDQVKAAVIQLLDPERSLSSTQYVFEPNGRPKPVFPHCQGCGAELQAFVEIVQACPDCKDAIVQFLQAYHAGQASESPAAP